MTEDIRTVATEVPSEQEQLTVLQKIHKGLCKFVSWLGFGSKYYKSSTHRKKIFLDVITYVVLIVVAIVMIYPFWWMIAASFASPKRIETTPAAIST